MKKKVLAVLLAGTMVFSMAACGGGSKEKIQQKAVPMAVRHRCPSCFVAAFMQM